ncbi:hypothetical protein MBH78_23485 [Oceanimonas sp. NS1]|nr:hypothetical protein [Oceanimonas sp. NS1]
MDPANEADRLLGALDKQTLGYFRDLPYSLVLGAGLARELKVGPGDKVRVTVTEGSRFTPLGRVPSQRLFTVVGTFVTGHDVDRQVALACIEDAGRLLRYQPEQASGLRLWLNDPFELAALPALDGTLKYETWQHSRGELFPGGGHGKRLMSPDAGADHSGGGL